MLLRNREMKRTPVRLLIPPEDSVTGVDAEQRVQRTALDHDGREQIGPPMNARVPIVRSRFR